MEFNWGRPLPPELLAEIHECLPLAEAINVLVNVPTRAIYQNNSPRMRRTIQRVKKSIKEYIDALVHEKKGYVDEEELTIHKNIEWKTELDAFLRYGSWLTPKRKLRIGSKIVGMPQNFVEKLLLHLSNSNSTKMMLHSAKINFGSAPIPSFLKQLFKENRYRSEGRIVFESVQLKADNGRTFCIYDGELRKCSKCYDGNYKLGLIVVNNMDRNNWFRIWMLMDSKKKFIRKWEFKQLPLDDKYGFGELGLSDCDIKQNGNKLEATRIIFFDFKLDLFLRRGADFTKFRHIKIQKINQFYGLPNVYVDFIF